ncbi:hypothetical protein CDEN61S_03599 [Castellaniella denitrificans]|uniref:phenol hydroxylase subunit n=1 Tax=Castellaniella sp. TaxID=1955812 RepID=UPI002AFE7A6C|nr:phenol hydroxylase subunit [Castellaniella sp.]
MSSLSLISDLRPATAEDMARRSVHVLSRRANGFVEFEFSIGWPELSVELMLPEADFQAFCKTHSIQNMTTTGDQIHEH